MNLESYRVSTTEGEECIYDCIFTLAFNVFKFKLYRNGKFRGKMIIIPSENVYRLETINKEEQVSDGPIIISNSKFMQYSRTVEAYDACLNNNEDDDYDPAS